MYWSLSPEWLTSAAQYHMEARHLLFKVHMTQGFSRCKSLRLLEDQIMYEEQPHQQRQDWATILENQALLA